MQVFDGRFQAVLGCDEMSLLGSGLQKPA